MSFTSSDLYDSAYASGLFGLTPNRAVNPIPSSREEILNTMITSVNINIEPLGPNFFKKCRNFFGGITVALPAVISPAGLSHASIYVPISENEGVWIEYGAYDDKRSGEFKGQVHYFQGNSGLRFAKMTAQEYQTRSSSAGEMQETVECYVRNQMTIRNLLQAVSLNDWSKHKYSLVAQNCQRFVVYALQVLGAYRKTFCIRGVAKVTIPFGILDCLEKNELNSTNENIRIFEKIPFFGTFFDLGFTLAQLHDMKKKRK